ncbi:MAG: M48 family metallopeptidase [Bdellovibrionota bacterium]
MTRSFVGIRHSVTASRHARSEVATSTPRVLLLVLAAFVLTLNACTPSLRITPGQLPHAERPSEELKSEAEHYVTAHVEQSNFREIHSGPELRRISAVVERLASAAGYPAHTFPVHLVNAGENVNAAAFNGASIVVYEELVRRVPADEGLATVLGHEIGHILAKHYAEQQEEETRKSAVSVGSSLLGTVASVATSAAGYGGAASLAGDVTEAGTGIIGYGAFVGSFNRRQEYEADHLGLLLMAKAGYDPRAAIDFWKHSAEVFGSSSSQAGAFLSTHPAESDRQKALEEAMPYALSFFHPTGSSTVDSAITKKRAGKKKP